MSSQGTKIAALAALSAGAVAFLWYALQSAEHARLRAGAFARLAAVRQERIATLEAELGAALESHGSVRSFVTERVAAEDAERAARDARLLAATQPMPDGLRLAAETLHDLLRRSGHHRLRVLALRAIEAKELCGLELFEAAQGVSEGPTLWTAEHGVLRLDRATGVLTIHLRDGHVVRGGGRSALPPGGESLALAGVDGRAFEERLPFLVVADGIYPNEAPPLPAKARLDAFTAQSWCDRLNELLAGATTTLRYRVTEIEGLAEAEFLGVVLLGSAGKRVEQMAEVERLAVVIDERAGIVELELIGGVSRRAGGDATLPASAPGQRILLTGVTPQAAARMLTGMVVRR